jgi:hypothetical protein
LFHVQHLWPVVAFPLAHRSEDRGLGLLPPSSFK